MRHVTSRRQLFLLVASQRRQHNHACLISAMVFYLLNHSDKVTCCTDLYKADFHEQIIKKLSEHASDPVRLYKRPSIESEQRVSDALQPPRLKSVPAAACRTAAAAAEAPTARPKTKTDNDAVSITLEIPSVFKQVIIVKCCKRYTF